ncbi:MAG: hypothetical protein JWQ40_1515 [Segetibacter sp.]|nr:hypothetical protein [Segetibacter sp.]
MSPEAIFKILNLIAVTGWLFLIASNWVNRLQKYIPAVIITLLAMVYTYLIFSNFQPAELDGFSTLAGVKQLFSNDRVLLAGWVHYLAFDLLTGCFIVNNARKNNINFWLILPCLFLTFMLGPVGLLLYFLLRWMITKNYFSQNF